MKKSGGHLDQLLHLEKSRQKPQNRHLFLLYAKNLVRVATFFIRVYLSGVLKLKKITHDFQITTPLKRFSPFLG